MPTAILSFALAALACYVFGFAIYEQLRRWNIIDKPNARSSHSKPTVRGGGIGIIAAVMFGCALLIARGGPSKALTFIAPLALLLAFISFLDDLKSLPALVRLGFHSLAVLAGAEWMDLPVLFAFILAGSAAGFLPHNFPKAQMFMGDVSSAPLGFLLACLSLWIAKVHGWWLLIPLTLLHANFVLDTGITLVRRVLRKEEWFSAHREHFYQRLQRAGHGHAFVTGIEMGLQLVVLGLMILYLQSPEGIRYVLIAAVVGLWLLFFGFCEVRFQRSFQLTHAADSSVLTSESAKTIP